MKTFLKLALLILITTSPEALLAQQHPRVSDLNGFRVIANDKDTMVRLVAISEALRSKDYVMRSLAYEEAFTDTELRIRQAGARSLLSQSKKLPATLILLPDDLDKIKDKGDRNWYEKNREFIITIEEFDENSGVGRSYALSRRGSLTVTQQGIQIELGSCSISLRDYISGSLVGSLSCGPDSIRIEVGMP
jgi:hypothetical protein